MPWGHAARGTNPLSPVPLPPVPAARWPQPRAQSQEEVGNPNIWPAGSSIFPLSSPSLLQFPPPEPARWWGAESSRVPAAAVSPEAFWGFSIRQPGEQPALGTQPTLEQGRGAQHPQGQPLGWGRRGLLHQPLGCSACPMRALCPLPLVVASGEALPLPPPLHPLLSPSPTSPRARAASHAQSLPPPLLSKPETKKKRKKK